MRETDAARGVIVGVAIGAVMWAALLAGCASLPEWQWPWATPPAVTNAAPPVAAPPGPWAGDEPPFTAANPQPLPPGQVTQ
jgi:hypothetical protein